MSGFKWDAIKGGGATAEALKHGRRLSDKILIAFHHACDSHNVPIAEELLGTLDCLLKRPAFVEDKDRREAGELLIDANYRLWDIKRSRLVAGGDHA